MDEPVKKRPVSYRPMRKDELQSLYMLLLYNHSDIAKEYQFYEENKQKLGEKETAWHHWKRMIDLVNEWGGGAEHLNYPQLTTFNKRGLPGVHDSQEEI